MGPQGDHSRSVQPKKMSGSAGFGAAMNHEVPSVIMGRIDTVLCATTITNTIAVMIAILPLLLLSV